MIRCATVLARCLISLVSCAFCCARCTHAMIHATAYSTVKLPKMSVQSPAKSVVRTHSCWCPLKRAGPLQRLVVSTTPLNHVAAPMYAPSLARKRLSARRARWELLGEEVRPIMNRCPFLELSIRAYSDAWLSLG